MEPLATPRSYSLFHHHSIWDPATTSDRFEPHAAVSRDVTRMMFNSSWDSNQETDIDAYMVQIPRSALPQ